jgi:hypothetical protein
MEGEVQVIHHKTAVQEAAAPRTQAAEFLVTLSKQTLLKPKATQQVMATGVVLQIMRTIAEAVVAAALDNRAEIQVLALLVAVEQV